MRNDGEWGRERRNGEEREDCEGEAREETRTCANAANAQCTYSERTVNVQ